MKPASNQLSNISIKFEVLLDIGSNSSSFFYVDSKNLGVEVGDIVAVRLKSRFLNGLVIAKVQNFNLYKSLENKIKIENFNSLSLISTIIEPGIFSINEKKYVITTAINNITNPLIRVNIILKL